MTKNPKKSNTKKTRGKSKLPPGSQPRTILAKDRFLKALVQTFGLITTTCMKIGIDVGTYYNWLADDLEFKARVMETISKAKERGLDFAETKLYELIDKKEPSAVYFYLKCQGKERGFYEKSLYAIEKSKKPESPLTDEQKARIADTLDNDTDTSSK